MQSLSLSNSTDNPIVVRLKHSGNNLLVEPKDICWNADASGTLRKRPYKTKRTVLNLKS